MKVSEMKKNVSVWKFDIKSTARAPKKFLNVLSKNHSTKSHRLRAQVKLCWYLTETFNTYDKRKLGFVYVFFWECTIFLLV